MDKNQKGEYAKQKVILRAIDKGHKVCVPTMAATRYDLVLDDGELRRVQVKYGDGKSPNAKGSITVNLATWDNKGSKKKCRTYTKDEIDFVLVYVPKLDQVLRLGPELFVDRASICIRLDPPKNNQQKGVNLATALLW